MVPKGTVQVSRRKEANDSLTQLSDLQTTITSMTSYPEGYNSDSHILAITDSSLIEIKTYSTRRKLCLVLET